MCRWLSTVGHRIKRTIQLRQPLRQQLTNGRKVAASGHQLWGETAAQIKYDAIAELIGGQESAERNRQHPVLVDRARQALPDSHRHIGIEHARRHREDAVEEGMDTQIADPHANPSTSRAALRTNLNTKVSYVNLLCASIGFGSAADLALKRCCPMQCDKTRRY